MWKNAKVVLLPTDKSELYLLHGKLNLSLHGNISQNDGDKESQHLYIISPDEDIKEGDWYFKTNENSVAKVVEMSKKANGYQWCANDIDGKLLMTPTTAVKYCKKIIATTDSSLQHAIDKSPYPMEIYGLPNIPRQFIDEYISNYNDGNVIEDVEVEYYFTHETGYDKPLCPKISKDNFISIKREKKRVYMRAEVVKLLKKFRTETYNGYSANKWIEQNL